jgi:arylsulfatase A
MKMPILLAALLAGACGATAPRPPNVVIFLVDDLGYGDLPCHGNPHVKAPQIDAFAKEAVEFASFHVSPVCAPTRASLMTGRYNFRTGIVDVFGPAAVMDAAEVTLAERLKAAGYATGIFGKWHLGDDAEHGPNAQGFDEALVHRGAAMRQYFNPTLLHNGTEEKRSGYCMDIFTDAAIDFIRANRAKPFFVHLPANLIHTPLQVAPELAAEFDATGLGDSTRKIYGMIRSVDAAFGRVRDTLRELGLEENTLLILFSDNGPCSGSTPVDRHMAGLHGLKGTVYENGIRVPCFMRWPAGFRSPAKVSRLAAHLDVLPTVLEACGVTVPAEPRIDGTSLMPLLRDPAAAWPDRALVFQWDSGQVPRRGHAYAVLTERWKLVQPCGMDAPNQQHIRDRYAELCRLQGRGGRSIEGPPRFELYDVAADPGETKDVSAANPDIVGEMRAQYDAWFTDVAARWAPPPAADADATARPPNIVLILADDLGYGDAGCNNPASKIPTPHIDRLAREGIRLTDAHAAAAICSPSRYGLLTGRYPWRNAPPGRTMGNVPIWGRPAIESERPTLASVLKARGYSTALIGKWHLGWTWPTTDGKPPSVKPDNLGNVDFTRPIAQGPTARGFDTYFGTCVPNYPPYCFIENDRTVGLPGEPSDEFEFPGPKLPGWRQVDILPELTRRAERHIADAAKAGRPFFLYLALTSPHHPVVPVPEFRGKSGAGDYGDFVVQTDATVGRVIGAIDRAGIAGTTLLVFTSDNGPEITRLNALRTKDVMPVGAYDRIREYGHASMGELRGIKYEAWEGGHRVPFVARWPGRIPAGATRGELLCLTDLMATFAAAAGATVPAGAGEDSFNALPLLLGGKGTRDGAVLQSARTALAVRSGDWVYIDAGAGINPEPDWFMQARGYTTNAMLDQLYRLSDDLPQRRNLVANHPEKVSELKVFLETVRARGRHAP